jgi:hypothetical protein
MMAQSRRASGWSAKQRMAFLGGLASAATPAEAAALAKTTVESALRLRSDCAEFARGWALASEQAVDLVEATMLHHAVHGVPRQIIRHDEVHKIFEFSSTLTMFVLRSFRPGRYGVSRRATAMPEVTPTMTRNDIVKRLRQLSLRVAAEDAGKPLAPLPEYGPR